MQSSEQFYVICVIQKKHRVKPISPEKSFPLTEKLAGLSGRSFSQVPTSYFL